MEVPKELQQTDREFRIVGKHFSVLEVWACRNAFYEVFSVRNDMGFHFNKAQGIRPLIALSEKRKKNMGMPMGRTRILT